LLAQSGTGSGAMAVTAGSKSQQGCRLPGRRAARESHRTVGLGGKVDALFYALAGLASARRRGTGSLGRAGNPSRQAESRARDRWRPPQKPVFLLLSRDFICCRSSPPLQNVLCPQVSSVDDRRRKTGPAAVALLERFAGGASAGPRREQTAVLLFRGGESSSAVRLAARML